jgi:hypothetical protein
MREGFGVLSASGRFAIAVPLAETMLAGWLLARANISSPNGVMTVAPSNPKDCVVLDSDGTLSGIARSVPFAQCASHIAVLASRAGSFSIALVDTLNCQIESGENLAADGSDNFFDTLLIEQIADALDKFDRDLDLRSSVLAAQGKAFCARANFNDSAPENEQYAVKSNTVIGQGRDLYGQTLRIFRNKKPIIAAVQGAAIGGGLGLRIAISTKK